MGSNCPLYHDADCGRAGDVPHVGISAHKICNNLGQVLMDEMKKRDWKPEETGLLGDQRRDPAGGGTSG